jgi:hypothetical protein
MEAIMKIILQTGQNNKSEFNLRDGIITVTIDPKAHAASNFTLLDAVKTIDAFIGRAAVMAFVELHRNMLADKSVWSPCGKWIGKTWSRSFEV